MAEICECKPKSKFLTTCTEITVFGIPSNCMYDNLSHTIHIKHFADLKKTPPSMYIKFDVSM